MVTLVRTVLHCWRRDSGALASLSLPCNAGAAGRGQGMLYWLMRELAHLIASNANALAILVTVGVAVLIVCCLECTKCPCREKDEIFKRHGV